MIPQGADHVVFDFLAHAGDLEGADSIAEIQVIQHVHHGGDFDGGGAAHARAEGDGTEDRQIHSRNFYWVEDAVQMENGQAADQVSGPCRPG